MPGPRRIAVPAALLILLGSLALPTVRATASPPEGVVPDLAALGWVPVLNEVWLFVAGDYAPGETCVDDIGIFVS